MLIDDKLWAVEKDSFWSIQVVCGSVFLQVTICAYMLQCELALAIVFETHFHKKMAMI